MLALVPIQQAVGAQIEQVLAVLAADHGIGPVDLAREQGHALVARRRAGHGLELEGAEVAGDHQFRRDVVAGIGGVGAAVERAFIVGHAHKAQIFQPVALLRGEGKDHRA